MIAKNQHITEQIRINYEEIRFKDMTQNSNNQ